MCKWELCGQEFESSGKLLEHLKNVHASCRDEPVQSTETKQQSYKCLWEGCKVQTTFMDPHRNFPMRSVTVEFRMGRCRVHLPQQWPNLRNIGLIYGIPKHVKNLEFYYFTVKSLELVAPELRFCEKFEPPK